MVRPDAVSAGDVHAFQRRFSAKNVAKKSLSALSALSA